MGLSKLCVVLVSLALCTPRACALTYEGYVEKTVVLEQPAVVVKQPEPDVEGHIGILVSTSGKVRHVHRGSPAEKAGIQPGDRVLLVDGCKDSVGSISGPPGTEVQLEVERPFQTQHLCFSIERIGVNQIEP